MDILSPLPVPEADARYELARLAEILPRVAGHLRALGVTDEAVRDCQALAGKLGYTILQAREASLMDAARKIGA